MQRKQSVHLSEAAGLALRLEQAQDIIFADRTLEEKLDSNGSSTSNTHTLTLRTMERDTSSMNSTRTWVTPPREPVRPSTFVTLASFTGVLVESMFFVGWREFRDPCVSFTHWILVSPTTVFSVGGFVVGDLG